LQLANKGDAHNTLTSPVPGSRNSYYLKPFAITMIQGHCRNISQQDKCLCVWLSTTAIFSTFAHYFFQKL